jgi:uncharacterized protein
MAVSGHVAALAAKHEDLENQITSESLRPLPDTATITQLKRAKLKLKEELSKHVH